MNDPMPVLFLGHGSPMNAIEKNQFSLEWQSVGKSIPKPSAILCISAHWETRGTMVTAMEIPETIHDFGGFPEELYRVRYPAPGSPILAGEVIRIITKTSVQSDFKWGLDHGSWSVLKHIYPEADVPVVQLSLDHHATPKYHYELAKELSPLREKGILIIGSGNMVHNLGLVAWSRMNDPEFGYDWAVEASEKMKDMILRNDHESLLNYKSQGRPVNLAIPTPEHFLPLLYILALKRSGEQVKFFNDKPVMGSLTMTCILAGCE